MFNGATAIYLNDFCNDTAFEFNQKVAGHFICFPLRAIKQIPV